VPLHIEELFSEVTVIDADSFLTEAQKEMLVQLVLKRMGDKARDATRKGKATELKRQAAPPFEVGRT
jgi:hypothetical protein